MLCMCGLHMLTLYPRFFVACMNQICDVCVLHVLLTVCPEEN